MSKTKTAEKPMETGKAETAIATIDETAKNEIAVMGNEAEDAFGEFAGEGFENVTQKDLLIPRITILQKLSPQLSSRKPEYIKGATEGLFCDVATSDTFPNIDFLPVLFRVDYLEWAPRASGKGLVAIHSDPSILDQCIKNEKMQYFNGENIVMETAQWFGLNMTADWRRSFIPLSSTGLRRSRAWMTLATNEKIVRRDGSRFTPPLFYRIYHLSSVETSNSSGEWFALKADRGPTLPEYNTKNWQDIKMECIEFRKSLLAGTVKADLASMAGDPDQPDESASNERAM